MNAPVAPGAPVPFPNVQGLVRGTLRVWKWYGVLLASLVACAATAALAGEEASQEVVTRRIVGTVGAVSPSYLAVVYQRDEAKGEEYELSLQVDPEVRIEHATSLRQIGIGDTVAVEYEEVQEVAHPKEEGDAPERRIKGRVAKVVTFLQPARTGLRSGR